MGVTVNQEAGGSSERRSHTDTLVSCLTCVSHPYAHGCLGINIPVGDLNRLESVLGPVEAILERRSWGRR